MPCATPRRAAAWPRGATELWARLAQPYLAAARRREYC
jgi:hypothetical protein